MTLKGIHFN